MTVKVCDALCGAGKTQGCIHMMNNDTEHKYIFITPYLDEVERIKKDCANRHFVSPERNFKNKYSKLEDLHSLLREGMNIASTHALFAMSTEETKELIRSKDYILVLDEVMDLFQPSEIDGGDINLLVRNNIAQKEGDDIVWKDDEYTGSAFSELRLMSESKNLVDYDGRFYFWTVPIEIFKCFKRAYVLTYLFEHQLMRHYFDVNNIEYELIGTRKIGNHHEFCELKDMDRKRELRDKIHIVNSEKYNQIGNESFSLSSGWFERASKEPGKPKLEKLKNNLYNIFRHSKTDNDDKMWTTLNDYRNELRGKGYSSGFITFNKRATNDFANRHQLAYCLNVFMMPWMKNYLVRIGATEVNQDMYALSVLIQWIFRSAVRKGEEVWLYVPSKRMRYILIEWLDNLAEGEDLKAIRYNAKKQSWAKAAAFNLKIANTKKRRNIK